MPWPNLKRFLIGLFALSVSISAPAEEFSVKVSRSMLDSTLVGEIVSIPMGKGKTFHGVLQETSNYVPGVNTQLLLSDDGYALISTDGHSRSIVINDNGKRYRFFGKGDELLADSDYGNVKNSTEDVERASDFKKQLLAPRAMSTTTDRQHVVDGIAYIDLQMVMDSRANNYRGGNALFKVAELIAGTNAIFKLSDVNIKLYILRYDWHKFSENTSMASALNAIRYDNEFKPFRKAAEGNGVDIVASIIMQREDDPLCSASTQGDFTGTEYDSPELVSIGVQCSVEDFAHAIGHNLGLRHSRLEGERGSFYPYGVGFGKVGEFHTLMAKPRTFANNSSTPATFRPFFSNPRQACGTGGCGIAHDDSVNAENPDSADAARALNEIAARASAIGKRNDDNIFGQFDSAMALVDSDIPTQNFNFPGDNDMYWFSFDTTRKLRIILDQPLELTIYGEDFTHVWQEVTEEMWVTLPEGKYYLDVRPLDIDDTMPYHMQYRFYDFDGSYLDTYFKTAGEGTVRRVTDFNSGERCSLVNNECTLSVPEDMPLNLFIEDGGRGLFRGFSSCNFKIPHGCNFKAGDTVTALVDQWVHLEEDHSLGFSDAEAISLGEVKRVIINDENDADFYRFTVNQIDDYYLWFEGEDFYQVEVYSNTESLKFGKYDMRVSGSDIKENRASLGRLTPGRYWLKVSANDQAKYSGLIDFYLNISTQAEESVIAFERQDGLKSYSVTTQIAQDSGYRSGINFISLILLPFGDKATISSVSAQPGYAVRLEGCDYYVDGGDCVVLADREEKPLVGEAFIDEDESGLPDVWEQSYPEVGGSDDDFDNDGLSNYEEFWYGTRPELSDSDFDGIPDNVEVDNKLNPMNHQDAFIDPDNDHFINFEEVMIYGTDIFDAENGKNEAEIKGQVANHLNWENVAVAHDYDGDFKADHAFYDPQTGRFYFESSGLGPNILVETDFTDAIPVSGDFDGDGITDIALYRQHDSQWWIRLSRRSVIERFSFSPITNGIPLAMDIDGDGLDEPVIRDADNGTWHINRSSDGIVETISFGREVSDIPLVGDINGDGLDDLIIRRPRTGKWYVKDAATLTTTSYFLGRAYSDIPFITDINGDGTPEIAIRRPEQAKWYIKDILNFDKMTEVSFGMQSADIPMVYDVDGDYSSDLVIRRASEAKLYWRPVENYRGVMNTVFGKQSHYLFPAAPLSYRMKTVPWAKFLNNHTRIEQR